MSRLALTWMGVAATVWLRSSPARCDDPKEETQPEPTGDDATAGDTIEAAEADQGEPPSKRSTWNEYDGRYFTLRGGIGLLVDYAAYRQDAASEQQLTLDDNPKVRDFRLLANGRLKFAPRVTYTVSYMRDGAFDVWRFRQTGIMVDIEELGGSLFIGRTKEGFSTVRLMVGYNGWLLERSAANDSFLPILADGVKWTGRVLGGKLVYNVGGFLDVLTKRQPFNKNDWQVAARAVWLPLAKSESESVLHLAAEARYGAADDGILQFRSKPESFVSDDYAVDTGELAASGHTIIGVEAYYRSGPLAIGTEYYFNQVSSDETDDPFFHGGELFAAYLLGGDRPYDERGAVFEAVEPSRSVFESGPGALELVLRYSYVDLDSGPVAGGKFWRITPMVNWYLSSNVRLEAAYGYGVLDRDNLDGTTHFFQTRLQLTLN